LLPEDSLPYPFDEPSMMDMTRPFMPPGLPGELSPNPMEAIPPIEDPPTQVPSDPPDAKGKIRKEIVTWAKSFMKASREFTKRKERDFELFYRLYNGRISRTQWRNWYSANTVETMTRSELFSFLADEATEDWSEFVYAPTHMVDTWIDNAYPLLFNNSEFLLVIPDNPQGPNIEDDQYPTAKKLQQLLLSKLDEGRIHARGYDALKALVIHGTCYAKVIWFSKEVPRWKWDLEQIERVEDVNLVSEAPVVQIIGPEKVLVDPEVEHNDVSRFRGIGHWVEKPYDVVLEGFRRGAFKLNESEFKRRFSDVGRKINRTGEGPTDDSDKYNLGETEGSWVRVWELHSAAPTGEGLKENVVTIITECGIDDPTDGLEIRITLGPILDCGLRPFVSAQFSPECGPFGKGQIERNVDLIFELSTLIGQFQDNVRATAHSILIVEEGSDADEKLKETGDKLIPGMIFRKQAGATDDPIKAAELSQFPAADVKDLIQYYLGLLERRMVSETFQGVSSREKSATESKLLYDQSMTPTQTRVDLFARQFLGPVGQIALAMLQQFLLEDQIITIKNDRGMDMPMTITTEELTTGRYRVYAALAKQDQQRIAKGNMIKEVLPIAERLKPIVMQVEGQDISLTELFRQFLHYADVEKIDKIVYPTPPPMPLPPDIPPDAGMPPDNLAGPGVPSSLYPLAENGGPMGDIPTDANINAQNIQMDRLIERGGRD